MCTLCLNNGKYFKIHLFAFVFAFTFTWLTSACRSPPVQPLLLLSFCSDERSQRHVFIAPSHKVQLSSFQLYVRYAYSRSMASGRSTTCHICFIVCSWRRLFNVQIFSYMQTRACEFVCTCGTYTYVYICSFDNSCGCVSKPSCVHSALSLGVWLLLLALQKTFVFHVSDPRESHKMHQHH